MKIEKQIIGSLLMDQNRIEDMHLINSEMFTEPIYGKIFSLYEHADGKEVNALIVGRAIISDFLTQTKADELIADAVNSHDPGVSDESCCKAIYDAYRIRKFEELIQHSHLTPQNIDNTIDDFRNYIDVFNKSDETRVKTISDLTAYKDEYFKDREKPRFEIGFSKIDKAIGDFDPGDLIIIAARPAVGKSAFTLQMIRKFGNDGFRVGYFNLEMGEKQIYERSIAATSGIDMTRIRLATTFLNDEREKFEKGNEQLSKEKNVSTLTGSYTISKIRAEQKKHKFDLIVIDYLQLIQSTSKRQNRATEVGDISRGLKAIAKDYNIPVIALSQLNRVSEMNKDKEPTMAELKESGDIEQDASVIIMLWNPNIEDTTEKKIKVEKSRNGYVERETLYFDGKHMTFSSLDFNNGIKFDNCDELPWN